MSEKLTGITHLEARDPSSFRRDIQGLRALAVLLVMIFHVFPQILPGGYIGVDVFFVISGFLISGLLMREREGTGRIDLLLFYERRIRRLMPAATLVLVVSAIMTYILLPNMRWIDISIELVASAFYFENWFLYFQSTDYLRADKLPSPFQHYWSLSIEEQFYLIWPVLIILVAAIAGFGHGAEKRVHQHRIYLVVLSVIFLASLYFSIVVTYRNQTAAYFLSYTRFWELALGALTSLLVPYIRFTPIFWVATSWVSILAIIYSAFAFGPDSTFPGYIALLPTCATALLLLGGGSRISFSAEGPLSLPVIRYIGDISYSLYLWHWPVIIFAKAWLGTDLTLIQGGGVIVSSLGLAALTKKFVEDWLRHRSKHAGLWRGYALFFVCGLVSLAAAAALYLPAANMQRTASSNIIINANYPGAMSLFGASVTPPADGPKVIPELHLARGDIPELYKLGCHVARPDIEAKPCEFAHPPNPEFRPITVMLVGDSHAAHWLPALRKIAANRGWTIISHTKSSCPFISIPVIVAQTEYPECAVWNAAVQQDILARQPDLVLTSMITNHFAVGATSHEDNQRKLAEGLKASWSSLLESDIPVGVFRGTPRMGQLVPECLADNPSDASRCALSREKAMSHGGAVQIATSGPDLSADLLDMTDAFCASDMCQPIVGNVLVYRDESHITATYMESLAGVLEQKIVETFRP